MELKSLKEHLKRYKDINIELKTSVNPFEEGTREFNTFLDIAEIAVDGKTTLKALLDAHSKTITVMNGTALDYYLSHDSLEALVEANVVEVKL